MKAFAGAIVAAAAFVIASTANEPASAHLTAVSPYTYWRDVLPIFEARCGRCHGEGSASGLELLNYPSARGATWLMRQRLIRGHMPPWHAEGAFVSPDPLTAREINILMTWASGAGPEGRKPGTVPQATAPRWPLGVPDLVAAMPVPFAFTAAQGEQIHEVVLPQVKIGGRTIRAIDLRAGTPALVRSAEIVARTKAREQVLALWQPGELPAPFAVNAGFTVERGARLVLRIRYRRLFGSPASDRSEVGVYFADRRAASIQSIDLSGTGSDITHTIVRPSRVVAIRPVAGPSGSIAVIAIARPDGSQRELGRIQIQRDWARRYVLQDAVPLGQGDRIVMSTIASQAAIWNSLTAERRDAAAPSHVVVEVAR